MRSGFVFGFFALLATSYARASTYSSTILYPLTLPAGFTSVEGITDVTATGAVGTGNDAANGNVNNAIYWSNGTATGLSPPGMMFGVANAISGNQQFGGAEDAAENEHALLWSGTSSSAVDFTPNGYTSSFGRGIGGNEEVGSGTPNGSAINQALVWFGTANSAVNLNPDGFATSVAYGTDGVHQVGSAGPSFNSQAFLWSGSADSAVNLNPSQFESSTATAVSGLQEVGYGTHSSPSTDHALVWAGTALSAVDLNPASFTLSQAFGTNGSQQVGLAYSSAIGFDNPMVWSGTALSAINLEPLLPSTGTWTDSIAYSIDPSGDIFGYADGTYNNTTGDFAVEWTPVPEPRCLALFVLIGLILLSRPRGASDQGARSALS